MEEAKIDEPHRAGLIGTSASALETPRVIRWAWAAVVVGLAIWVGYQALNTTPMAVGLLAALPLLWAVAPGRWSAGLAAGGFVMAANWSVAPGAAHYFDGVSLVVGFAALAAVGSVHALVWTAAWTRGVGRPFTALIAILLLAISPLMWVGWSSPLNAAGVFLPGLGWTGLGVFLAIVMALVLSRWIAAAALAVLIIGVAMLGPGMPGPATATPSATAWAGVDTALGGLETTRSSAVVQRQRDLQRAIASRSGEAEYLVLPEMIAGVWGFAEPMWSRFDADGSVVFLGVQIEAEGPGYYNSLMTLGSGTPLRYDQRVPIPWANWNPWDPESARANPMGPAALEHEGQTIGVLICYEQLVVFPILTTLLEQPDVILAPANAWWVTTPAIPAMQENIMESWSRLFGIPIVTAINYPADWKNGLDRPEEE